MRVTEEMQARGGQGRPGEQGKLALLWPWPFKVLGWDQEPAVPRKSGPDLRLPTQNYAIHLEAIFKLKCCQRPVTVLIFLFCSLSIHPHFLVGLGRGARVTELGLDSEIFGIFKGRQDF